MHAARTAYEQNKCSHGTFIWKIYFLINKIHNRHWILRGVKLLLLKAMLCWSRPYCPWHYWSWQLQWKVNACYKHKCTTDSKNSFMHIIRVKEKENKCAQWKIKISHNESLNIICNVKNRQWSAIQINIVTDIWHFTWHPFFIFITRQVLFMYICVYINLS